MNEHIRTNNNRRYLIIALILVVIGIGITTTSIIFCDATTVPNAGVVPVTAATVCLTGRPGGKTKCPWAPAGAMVGPPPAGTTCAAAVGDTCDTPGARCNLFGACIDTYHLQTTQCECRCD